MNKRGGCWAGGRHAAHALLRMPLHPPTTCSPTALWPSTTYCSAFLLPPLPTPHRFGGGEELADDAVVASRLDSQRLYGHQERNCIGFVHENKNPRRTAAHLNTRPTAWQGQEKQLRIRS